MDKDQNIVESFANVLRNSQRHKEKYVSLYGEKKTQNVSCTDEYAIKDVISGVTKQLRAIQNADNAKKCSNKEYISKSFQKSHFQPVHMLSVNQQPKQMQSNKFDTQCVSDTQLINMIEDAEAFINVEKGLTEEFDTTFLQKDLNIDCKDNQREECFIKTDNFNAIEVESKKNETQDLNTDNILPHMNSQDIHNLSFYNENVINLEKDSTNMNVDICVSLDKCFMESHEDNKNAKDPKNERNNTKIKETRSLSTNGTQSEVKQYTSSPPSPLVFKLESFERFETFALSIIKENHDDFETAKKVINSQIMNRELFIHSHAEPVLSDRDKNICPVINNTMQFNSDIFQDKSENTDIKLKSTIEDSMLFSSDEENNGENSSDLLPLTCALKVSLHNEPGILDKTMYVGFQTASNKSIQICTDSFSKAKQLFDKVNMINMKKLDSDVIKQLNVDMDTNKNPSCGKIVQTLKNNDDFVINKDSLVDHIENSPTILSTETSKNTNNVVENNDIICKNHKGENSIQCLHHVQLNFAMNDCNISNSKKIKQIEELVNYTKKENNNNNQKIQCGNTIFKDIQLENDADDSLISQDFGYVMSDNEKINLCDISKININDMLDYEKSEILINNNSLNKDTVLETSTLSTTAIRRPLNDKNKIVEEVTEVTKENMIDENSEKNERIGIGKIMSNIFVGFKTANNKEIKISTEAFKKTINIFDNIDSDNSLPQKTGTDNFENLSSLKAINSISKKFFVNPFIPKKLHSASSSHIDNSVKPPSRFISISHNNVLSNTSLPINKSLTNALSTKTLSTPKKFISDNLICDGKSGKQYNNIISNPLDKIVLDEEPNAASKSDINYILNDFKTAKYKAVKESKATLANTNQIFNNFNIANINTNRNLDTHQHKDSIESHHTELFQGFKTASNKPVQISERALAVTKNIFGDIPLEENITVNEDICSFEIPLINNQVLNTIIQPRKISRSSLTKVKDVHKDTYNVDTQLHHEDKHVIQPLCPIDSIVPKTTLQGFKTASNKTVKISDKALSATKRIFKDISFNDENETETINNDCNNTGKENLLETVNCKTTDPIFQGFKTANSKPVAISIEALLKSKKLFDDMDIDSDEKSFKDITKKQVKNTSRNSDVIKGLKPASGSGMKLSENVKFKVPNKYSNSKNLSPTALPIQNNYSELKKANQIQVNVSEDTQKRTQKLVSDSKSNCETDKAEENVLGESFFNTEVIKDFELTVCTENFMNTDTFNGKRSGSPILSCPRAKKRKKFETSKSMKKHVASEKTECEPIVSENMYTFNQNYKKNKKISLKDLDNIKNFGNEKTKDTAIPYIQFENLLDFEFIGERIDIDNNKWTTDTIVFFFIQSVNQKIIPDGWIENHLKLIIWKLLSYEIRFPLCMKNVCTVTNVLDQLKYRYDRELYNVERPALRKILEKDEVSTRRMILCVAGVYIDGLSVSSIKNDGRNIELLLTDGWYTVKASTDRMIDRLVCDGKITVGTKLVIYGAELLNCEEGISPWEDTSSVRLKISGNSTRRAKWDARLGFHSNGPILTNLSAVTPEGGKISHLRAHVTRVYPALYVEKFPDGSTLTRSERLENIHQTKYETERELQMEKLYDEMEKLSDQESQDSEGLDEGAMDTGSLLSKLMKRSRDREGFREKLTSTQTHLLQQHTMMRKEKFVQDFQTKFLDLVKQRGLDVPRNVVPLLKIRVADVEKDKISKAMITIWKPNESLQELIKEGTCLDIYNVVPTSLRYSEIQISAGRQSIFRKSTFKEPDKLKTYIQTLKRQCYCIKDLQNPTISTNYNEIDTVGIIFLIEPPTKEFELKNQPFQNVYLSDADKNMICVNFWGGIKKFGFEILLDIGGIVTCVNLQKRAGNTRKNIPQYRATELSYFTKTSRLDTIKRKADDLAEKFYTLDKRKFIDDCIALKNNFHIIKCGNTENISPYRLNASDYNIHKNKMFIDSPLVNKCKDVNYNLTGLDFESTFKQTNIQELSPQTLARKKKVDEKIARLKMYGEPPPLSPIHILNKSNNAANQFKSPLTKLDISSSDTNANILPHNNEEYKIESNSTSPILNLNRTYVKRPSINPVKLNFSNIESEFKNNIIDPFGEEFDCSPPLSLD